MAASNYSDVVQTLAQQIVDACMQTLRKNLQGMVQGLVINADQIQGDVTNVDGTSLIVDAGNVQGLSNYISSELSVLRLDAGHLYSYDNLGNAHAIATVAEDGTVSLNNVSIQTAEITDLTTQWARIFSAEIDNALVQKALVDSLTANFARISDAKITNATIDMANVNVLNAVSAEVANLLAQNANIDFAQIKALSTQDVLIQKGLGGKLYIADLAVTEANMVSLTVGELVVKGEDGKFYSIEVDENGEVHGVEKPVTNANLEDLAVTGSKIANGTINGDTKIIESSITARTLNVQDIFAQNAMVLSLIAQNINVDDLFANQAFINKLMTTDISSNTSLQLSIQAAEDAMSEEISLRLSDGAIISTVTGSQEFNDIVNERTQQTVTVMYCIGDNGTEPPGPTADWSLELPEATWGDYIWTRSVTEYNNGQPSNTVYYVSFFGDNPADGIVLKITSDTGFTYKEPTGNIVLRATVYAGGNELSNADVNALGCIQWFKGGTRVTGAAITGWNELTVDLSTVGGDAVYTAKLMG